MQIKLKRKARKILIESFLNELLIILHKFKLDLIKINNI